MAEKYYIIPDIEALDSATSEERTKLMRRIAVNVGSPLALRRLLGIDPEEFRNFYPDQIPPDLNTEDTIDTFLDRYAPGQAESDELPMAPAVDYAALIDAGAENPAPEADDETTLAIDAFLSGDRSRKSTTAAPQAEEKAELPEGTDLRCIIKNGDYTRALEIIRDQDLNNPEKSIYFAHQISFLEKLVKNRENARH